MSSTATFEQQVHPTLDASEPLSVDVLLDNLNSFSVHLNSKKGNAVSERSEFQDLPIAEGLALIEGALHQHYGIDHDQIEDYEFTESSITIELADEGVYSGASLEAAYNTLLASTNNALAQNEDLVFFLIDLEKAASGGDEDVSVTLILGRNGLPNPCWPNETDNWYVCCEAGKCDGSNVGKDASEREEDMLNAFACRPYCQNGSTELWLATIGIPFTYDDSPLGNLRWTTYSGSNYRCLTSSEISTNINILKDIVKLKKPTSPFLDVDYSMKVIDVVDWTEPIGDTDFSEHNGRIYYNITICNPGGNPPNEN